MSDTIKNEKTLLDTEVSKSLPTDVYRNSWCVKRSPKGQVWAQVRDNQIRNGGINIRSRSYSSPTALSRKIKKFMQNISLIKDFFMTDVKNSDKTLTALQGYSAVRQFLKAFGTLNESDDILVLCKKLELLTSDTTVNSTVFHQWAWCVNQALTEKEIRCFRMYNRTDVPVFKKIENFPEIIQDPNQPLTYLQAYVAMQKLVEIYYFNNEASGDLGTLAGSLAILESDGLPMDPAMWEDWLEAVEVVLKRESNGASNK